MPHIGGFIGGLPKEYKSVVRPEYLQTRPFQKNSVKKSLLGLNFTYDYNTFFADSGYEDRLFRHLSRIAKPAPLSVFQKLYNGNDENSAMIPQT